MENLFFFIFIFIFFLVNIIFTQRIYSKNYIILILICSLLMPLSVVIFFSEKKFNSLLSLSMVLFYYSLLLFLIKKGYKFVNTFLIERSVIGTNFIAKDFTYVNWSGGNPTIPKWWDGELAKAPSSLDIILTVILLTVPFLLCVLTNSIIKVFLI